MQPMDPFHQQAPVLKPYPDENTPWPSAVCVTTDMEALYGWLEQQMGMQFWKKDSPRQELLQSYTDILASTYSQSLVCLLDNRLLPMDISQPL